MQPHMLQNFRLVFPKISSDHTSEWAPQVAQELPFLLLPLLLHNLRLFAFLASHQTALILKPCHDSTSCHSQLCCRLSG